MSRYPDFVTEEGIARRLAEGRGSGFGPHYKPYLTRFDVPSIGERRESYSRKCGRGIHYLSRLEYHLGLIAEEDDEVVEIREQFPLPRGETQEIAKRLGVRHPFFRRTGCDVVMTTDLLLTRKSSSGTISQEALSAKRADAARHWRTAEKQSIERSLHHKQGHSFRLITECDIPGTYVNNLDWIHSLRRPDALLGFPVHFADEIDHNMRRILSQRDQILWQAALACDHALNLSEATSLYFCRFFLACRRWRTDLQTWNRKLEPIRLLT